MTEELNILDEPKTEVQIVLDEPKTKYHYQKKPWRWYHSILVMVTFSCWMAMVIFGLQNKRTWFTVTVYLTFASVAPLSIAIINY